MKRSIYFFYCLFVLSFSIIFAACSKTQPVMEIPVSIPEVTVNQSNHNWFYFSRNEICEADKIQNVPQTKEFPWTEARRISSANNTVNPESEGKAFAIVNRMGIICFEDDKFTFAKDNNLFNDRTAGNIAFLNDTPVYTVYKSSFFNDTITEDNYKKDNSQHLFLLQFDDNAKISYPVLNCNNLTDESNTEVIDFNWDGMDWLCCLKTINNNKIEFSYIKWAPTVSLLEVSPSTAKNKIRISESDVDTFRTAKTQYDFSKAPDRIKKLLDGFTEKLSFSIEVKNAGGTGAKIYENSVSSDEKTLNAKAIISHSWSCAIFEDGTLFIEGALPGKHILRQGKTVAIRLPKLPPDFVYSDFVISGTTLYAAWEEKDFYNIGRSGFLKVNLEDTLYSKVL